MAATFVDESAQEASGVRPETLPGAEGALGQTHAEESGDGFYLRAALLHPLLLERLQLG